MNKAEHIINFIEKCLHIPQGNRKCNIADGSNVVLLDWQKEFIRNVYGNVDDRGIRKIREAFLCLPRKNGKTGFLAFIALYHLIGSGRRNEQIYCFASTLNQSRLLFQGARDVIYASPVLMMLVNRRLLRVYKNSIEFVPLNNVYQCKPATPNGLQGLNPSVALLDELHVWEDPELYNVIATAQNARDEGLMISITTAGTQKTGICYTLVEYTKQLSEGKCNNPYFYGKIYGIEEGEDWESEEVWKKCNPSMGHTFSIEELRIEYLKAKGIPSLAASFKRYYLNQWIEDKTVQLIDTEKWKLCGNDELKLCDYKEVECYIGVDLSARNDITAIVAVFQYSNTIIVYPTFFLPSENIDELKEKHKVDYPEWVRKGYIKLTDGEKIDYQYVSDYIIDTFRGYNIKAISLDIQFQGQAVSNILRAANLPVYEEITGTFRHSEATKRLERLINTKQLRHNNNPVMDWMAGNSYYEEGNRGDIRLCKKRKNNRYKIDGITALVQALNYIKIETKAEEWTLEDLENSWNK